jgi:hypothetical protein
MPLDRSWYNQLVNDSGGGKDGTVWRKEDVDSLMDAVDAELARLDAFLQFPNGVFERGRGVALGAWQNIPYNPSDFTVSGTGSWSVPQKALVRNRYTLIGETLIWSIYIAWFVGGTEVEPSVVTGNPNALQIALPPGLVAIYSQGVPMALGYNNNVEVEVFAGGAANVLQFVRVDRLPWAAGPTGFVGTMQVNLFP